MSPSLEDTLTCELAGGVSAGLVRLVGDTTCGVASGFGCGFCSGASDALYSTGGAALVVPCRSPFADV